MYAAVFRSYLLTTLLLPRDWTSLKYMRAMAQTWAIQEIKPVLLKLGLPYYD